MISKKVSKGSLRADCLVFLLLSREAKEPKLDLPAITKEAARREKQENLETSSLDLKFLTKRGC